MGLNERSESLIPQVNGYSFLLPPTPVPTKHAPIVTWGSITGTPVALEPVTPSSSFRVPETSARDKVALALAEQAQKKIKQRAQATPVPFSPRSQTAQKFVDSLTKRNTGFDALRSSYTPSASPRTQSGGIFATPATPASTRKRTQTPNPAKEKPKKKAKVDPEIMSVEASAEKPIAAPAAPVATSTRKSSITDNLL